DQGEAPAGCILRAIREMMEDNRLQGLQQPLVAARDVKAVATGNRRSPAVPAQQRMAPMTQLTKREGDLITERLEVDWVPTRDIGRRPRRYMIEEACAHDPEAVVEPLQVLAQRQPVRPVVKLVGVQEQ